MADHPEHEHGDHGWRTLSPSEPPPPATSTLPPPPPPPAGLGAGLGNPGPPRDPFTTLPPRPPMPAPAPLSRTEEATARRGPGAGLAVSLVVLAALLGALAGAVAGYATGHSAGRSAGRQAAQGAPTTTAVGETTTSTAPGSTVVSNGAPSTTVGSTGSVADVPAIAAAIRKSVVSIEVVQTGYGPYGRPVTQQAAGTGFVLTANGQIATNNHVVAGATSITVTLPDGAKVPATLVGASAADDLAVVKVDRGDLTPVSIGSSGTLRVGETVVAMGNALALPGGPTVSAGIVSALGRTITVNTTTYPDLIQTDAAISSGNSGGPLVDRAGRVVGINSAAATSSTAENIGFAIAIDHAVPVLRSLGATI